MGESERAPHATEKTLEKEGKVKISENQKKSNQKIESNVNFKRPRNVCGYGGWQIGKPK